MVHKMRAEFLTHHVRCEILRRNTKTVLVMTDCPITRQLLSTLLWLKKYKVVMRSSSDAENIYIQCVPKRFYSRFRPPPRFLRNSEVVGAEPEFPIFQGIVRNFPLFWQFYRFFPGGGGLGPRI